MMLANLANKLFLCFVAILPFAQTTALKNLIFLLLICGILLSAIKNCRVFLTKFATDVTALHYLFVGYLLIFPLISIHETATPFSVIGHWLQAFLGWIVAMSMVWLNKERISIKQISLSHAVIVGIFFGQLIFASSGLFGHHPPSQITLENWRIAIHNAWTHGLPSLGASVPFPFVGYDEMHGNLGYAGSQVIALATAWYLFGISEKSPKARILALLLIGATVLSAVWISSRGALVFDLLILCVAFINKNKFCALFEQARKENINEAKPQFFHWSVIVAIMVIFVLIGSQTILKDERWLLMTSKLEAGWSIKDPVGYVCHGFQPGEREQVLERLKIQNPEMSQKIMAGFEQDAGRVLLLQVGWQLVKETPWGIDGTRQSYEKAIAAKCGGQPVHAFAHAHNGWINMALSFGWLGAVLYFTLLMQMAILGWRRASKGLALPWSSALFLVAVFWIIRGLVDACYQDHYIQMQGVLLGYLYARTKFEVAPDSGISNA